MSTDAPQDGERGRATIEQAIEDARREGYRIVPPTEGGWGDLTTEEADAIESSIDDAVASANGGRAS